MSLRYRDNTGLEADAILERTDGTWIAVEIKLSTIPKRSTTRQRCGAVCLRWRRRKALCVTGMRTAQGTLD